MLKIPSTSVKGEYPNPSLPQSSLQIPRIPITNSSRVDLQIRRAPHPVCVPIPSNPILIFSRSLIKRQNIPATSRSTHNPILSRRLPLFPAWKVCFLSRHETAWVEDVEEDESKEHEGGVEDVLVGLVTGYAAVNTFGILDKTEYYTDLIERGLSDGFLSVGEWRIDGLRLTVMRVKAA